MGFFAIQFSFTDQNSLTFLKFVPVSVGTMCMLDQKTDPNYKQVEQVEVLLKVEFCYMRTYTNIVTDRMRNLKMSAQWEWSFIWLSKLWQSIFQNRMDILGVKFKFLFTHCIAKSIVVYHWNVLIINVNSPTRVWLNIFGRTFWPFTGLAFN